MAMVERIGWNSRVRYFSCRQAVLMAFLSICGISGATVLFKTILPVNSSTAGFSYLILVLVTAAYGGLAASVLASIAATICFNYFFLPPVGRWTIADPHNIVALMAFFISALITSHLSASARRRAAEATSRQRELEKLYRLSQAIISMDMNQSMARQIAEALLNVCDLQGVGVYDSSASLLARAGRLDIADLEGKLETAASGASLPELDVETLIQPLILGDKRVGSIAMCGNALSGPAVRSLISLIAITLDNARSHQIASNAETTRQKEEFKSTLLDALAHEFKTPLTSIKAATTALLSPTRLDSDQRGELLAVVDQEADRLSRLVTEATHLARIEARRLQLCRELRAVPEVLGAALDQLQLGRDGRTVDLSVAPGIPLIPMDFDLMQLAIRQLLDNAAKYSDPRSAIGISVRLIETIVEIGIHNWGEMLPEAERTRIFEKFYRGSRARDHVLGTGMGLPIAREILLAHGGNIRVESSAERGTEFIVTLPIESRGV